MQIVFNLKFFIRKASNDGKGKFYQDSIISNGLLNALGMVTDALWVDINKDGNWELLVAAEWANLRAFQFSAKGMIETTEQVFKDSLFGWWNKLQLVDIDNDGEIQVSETNQVFYLEVSFSSINDMSGIENFTIGAGMTVTKTSSNSKQPVSVFLIWTV